MPSKFTSDIVIMSDVIKSFDCITSIASDKFMCRYTKVKQLNLNL